MSTLLLYVLRIWMYVSPVLFSLSYIKAKTVPDAAGHTALPHWILYFYQWDPFSPIINSWNTVLVGDGPTPFYTGGKDAAGHIIPAASYSPQMTEILAGTGCAIVALVIRAWHFLSREGEVAC